MKKKIINLILMLCLQQGLIAQNTNNALHFKSNDYVELNIAKDVNSLTEFTVEFWVNFDAEENTDYNTFYAVNTLDYGNRFLIRCAGSQDGIKDAAIVLINDGSNQYIIGTTTIGDNKCHHIAFTYSNEVCSLYVDGQLDGFGNYRIDLQESDLHSLGQEYDRTPNPTSAFYNGKLDDFRIWNTAKSKTEIDTDKGIELIGNEANLITYFNFNQGIPSAKNTDIKKIINKAQPSQEGILVNFSLKGSASNFIISSCFNSSVEPDKNVFSLDTTNILNIQFDTSSDHLLSESLQEIEKINDFMNQYPSIHIEVHGHTDNQGSSEFNKDLSQRRANVVKQKLIKLGINESRIHTKGFGDTLPVATNDTSQGRQKNRRTEFIIIKK